MFEQIDSVQVYIFVFIALLLALLAITIAFFIKSRIDIFHLKKALYQKKDALIEKKKSSSDRKNYSEYFEALLRFAGLEKLGSLAFIAIGMSSMFVGAILVFKVFDNAFAILIGAALGVYIPYFVLQTLMAKRKNEFNFALSDAISILVRMMRNGVGFEQAFKRAISLSQSKVFQSLFEKYMKEKDLIGDEKAFESMFKYVQSTEIRIFALSISIGKSSGGKFSSTLEKLENSIKQRISLQKKITVATQEAKVGSYMIVGILVLLFVMMNSNFNGALVNYFFGTEGGKMQMMLVMLWVSFGLFINSVLTKLD